MKKLIFVPDLGTARVPERPLSPQRAERSALLNPEDRRRFAAAEGITCGVLKRYFGLSAPRILGKAGERPRILDSAVSFSRSYAGNALVIAVQSSGIIGVDCEPIRAPEEGVMKYFFTPTERDFVRRCPDPGAGFSLIWTRKEAYVKCTGDGLHFPWHTLETAPARLDLADTPLCRENAPVGGMFLNSFLLGGMAVSVCSSENDRFPPLVEWSSYETNDP